MPPINLNESRLLLPEADLRTLQVVAAAMAATIVGFAVVVVVMAVSSAPAPATHETTTLLGFLSLLHAICAGFCYAIAGALFTRSLSRAPDETEGPADPAEPYLRLRGAVILRLALMEAPAYFGLACCLIGATRGILHEEAVYWLNLLSTLVFLAFAVQTFPSRARVEYLLSRMAAKQERGMP